MNLRMKPGTSTWGRYAFAVLVVAGASLLRASLAPVLGHGVPFILYFPTVVACAWFGGLGPGLLSVALGALVAWYVFIPPAYSLAAADPTASAQLAVFLLAGVLISGLAESLRRATRGRAALLERERAARVAAEHVTRTLQRVQRVTDAAIGEVATDRVIRELLARAREALASDTATILRVSEDGTYLTAVSSDGLVAAVDEGGVRIPMGRSVAGRIATSQAGLIVPDLSRVEVASAFLRDRVKSLVGVPLRAGDRLLGVLHVGSTVPHQFTEDDLTVLRLVGERVAVALDRGRLHDAERLARAERDRAEERLRLALEAGRMGTWEWTIASGAVRWSPGLEAIHGLPAGGFPGTFEAFQRDIHPEDRERVLQAVRRAAEERGDYHVEYRIVRPDGTVRWVEGRGQLFPDPEGRPERMVGVCSDVTERKQVEQVLADQAHLLRTIDDALYEVDTDMRILSWNRAAERLYGYAAAEAIGRYSPELLRPRISPAERAAYVKRLERGEVVRFEAEFHRKDGTAVWVNVTAFAKRDPDGGVHSVVSIHRDVTELRRADERFRLAIEAAPAAMIMVDRHGTVVLVNALMERLFGYSRDEIVGQPLERLVPPRYRHGHPEFRRAFLAAPAQRPMGVGRDLYALRKDGSEIPVEIGLSPIETEDGTLVLAAVTDITERKRRDEERAQLLAREQAARADAEAARGDAEAANRVKDEFLAMLSHELRSPLNAIVGFLHALKTKADPDVRRAVEVIDRNTRVVIRLVDDLLDVSRIVAGRLAIERRPVAVAPLVSDLLDTLAPAVTGKGLRLDRDVDPSAGVVAGDAARLHQAIGNLVTNAIKFTPAGGSVAVRVQGGEAEVAITVSDTGQGIAPEFLPHVFERFQQEDTSPARTHGGLGLGLAIVRHIVEAHGGTVTVESPGRGRGARVGFRLAVLSEGGGAPASSR